MKVIQSAFLFILGFLKRIYWILPTLILDPFGLVERFFNINYDIPLVAIWSIFALGCMIAFVLTYNELRVGNVVKFFAKRPDSIFFNKEIIEVIQHAYSFKGRKGLLSIRDIISKHGTYEEYIDAEIKGGKDVYGDIIVYPHNWKETFPGEYPKTIGIMISPRKVEKLIISNLLEKGLIIIRQNRKVEVNAEFIRALEIFIDYY